MSVSKKRSAEPAKTVAPAKLPSGWALSRSSAALLWRHKGLFGGIIFFYALLSLVLVRGFGTGVQLDSVHTLLGTEAGKFVGSLAAYTWLINSSATGTNQVAAVYQIIVLIIVSLAVVWALRQVMADGKAIRVRDAFYQGMYPIIPVALVIVTIFIQLIPLLLGLTILGYIGGSAGIAIRPVEIIIGCIIVLALVIASLYFVVSSIFAFYIAALPDMTPMRALRSSRQLVRGRRLSVLRKLLWLPFILLVAGMVIMVPIILLATPVAPWAAFILTILMLPVIHAYLYSLYRELIA